jgi:tetratricopeptide (TPR) repeat protein
MSRSANDSEPVSQIGKSVKRRASRWRLELVLALVTILLLKGSLLISQYWTNLGLVIMLQPGIVQAQELQAPAAERAEALLRRATDVFPGNCSAWHALGFALVAQDQENGALEAWRNVPNIAREFLWRGDRLRLLKRFSKALTWYNRAAQLDADSYGRDIWYGIGDIRMSQGKWNLALKAFTKCPLSPNRAYRTILGLIVKSRSSLVCLSASLGPG